jgi:hypothetical protein
VSRLGALKGREKPNTDNPQKGNPKWKVRKSEYEQPVKEFEASEEHKQANLQTCCKVKLLKVDFMRSCEIKWLMLGNCGAVKIANIDIGGSCS